MLGSYPALWSCHAWLAITHFRLIYLHAKYHTIDLDVLNDIRWVDKLFFRGRGVCRPQGMCCSMLQCVLLRL